MTAMSTLSIGYRIKALREAKGISQEDLARAFGFKDRQTVSAIETGERRVSAEELVRAGEVLGKPLDFFTDPFLLVGEGRFSWRQSGVIGRGLDEYEVEAGRFIAAYQTLAPQIGREAPLLRHALPLTKDSRFEDATAAGERFAAEFKLGAVPAARLSETMERELGILVLMVDAIQGISGAACRLSDLDVVLINRREVPGRRHFDLAHELFHILTWEAMPPEHVEQVAPKRRTRVEQLADNFASALLMPADALDGFGDWSSLDGDGLVNRLNKVADDLRVTASALRWRLISSGRLDKSFEHRISDSRLRNNGRSKPFNEPLAPLFSQTFMEVIGRAIDEGRVAVRRVAQLLNLSIDDLSDLFTAHGVKPPYDV
jgi:Zn-dependent peptidase ImmA (M78 family)/transcriptional regulator with XRE-family HTH domain